MPVFTRSRQLPGSTDNAATAAESPPDDADASARPSQKERPAPLQHRLAALQHRLAPLQHRLAHRLAWRTRHPAAARALRRTTTVLAAALVLGALLLPNTVAALRPDRFARIPAEAIIAAAVLLALPRRPRLVAAVLCGAGLGALTVVNVLDMGFREYLGRGFNIVLDWELLDDARSYVADSMGGTTAALATAGAVGSALLLPVLMALATVRIGELLAAHRDRATRGALLAGTVWITCSALGLQLFGTPLASRQAAWAAENQARLTVQTLRDEAAFAKEAKKDAFGATPGDQLVPDLRGKDVIFAFIESYGRTALEDPLIAPGVDRTLDTSAQALTQAGYRAKSGWLTSATFGSGSWLGHSTFMSGLWVSSQQRYRTVTAGDHLTLTEAFARTGAWDTVGIMPGVQKAWPEGEFYGLDKVYDAFDLGYRGPKFSWSTMPDQYALEAFQRLEHGRERDKDLMAAVILTSSHQPWAPIPRMVGWEELGDGRIFESVERAGEDADDVIADTTRSREEYGKSVQYSLTSLTQWLERYGDDDTVLVFLGDHQPRSRVSGNDASRDVPVTIVAKDPRVLDKIDDWDWTEGLRPAQDAPVWRMDAFRDRFLTAYGSTPHPSGG
ncbi:CDP-alcohol phosphatidyltransferase [Streptomyces sp. HMX87]|uniref:CDP-alcohol phosphatidyltransferase n=1 Tax=Streptomyces sp. HMX87 TaxID=3390849 RepID=UPI003A857902